MHAIILAGGTGSRLWPISTKQKPKPFIRMNDGQSLIQKAFIRAAKIESIKNIITVTAPSSLPEIKYHYNQITDCIKISIKKELIIEPCGKDTAGAIIAATVHIANNYGSDEIVLVLPSDHIILDSVAFEKAVSEAQNLAGKGKIVTLGIKPSSPEVGYGYIELDDNNEAIRFIEKPSPDIALKSLKSGNFLWNSGILCFTAKAAIEELKTHCPDIFRRVDIAVCMSESFHTSSYKKIFLNQLIWEKVSETSIDYALLEKTNKIAVVPCDIGWSDVGNWGSISKLEPADKNGNIIKGNAVIHDASDCYIESSCDKKIAVVGVKNLAIIQTDDGFLVVDKNKASKIKDIKAYLTCVTN